MARIINFTGFASIRGLGVGSIAPKAIFLALLFALGYGFVGLPNTDEAAAFTFQDVVNEARETAASSYKSPAGEVPDTLMKITYDEWRDIRFMPANALWRKENLPFTVQFFHPGLYFDHTVKINIIDPEGNVRKVPFQKEHFDYKSKRVRDLVPSELGFAGFRIHHPINKLEYQDEVCVFLGASYFRAVARNMSYGLSARGLGIDTYLPSGEEFPYFRKFWIIQPSPSAVDITLYALMDSPSLSGAYQFIVCPGKETVMYVKSTIFLRKKVQQLEIAPFTSMFFYGENTSIRPVDDFRPEIHDSDGLMMETGTGEWIWRPLVNPKNDLLVSSFETTNPKGLGICQRDQDYENYQDMESYYENRPSLWISPTNEWGKGHMKLIQIHTMEEIHDNIVAFWVPENLPELGAPFSFDYRMSWHHFADGNRPPGGLVVATRTAQGKKGKCRKFVVDFAGQKLESLGEATPPTAVVSVGPNAELLEQHVAKNRVNGRWRLVFEIKLGNETEPNAPVELRAYLKQEKDVLTETWSYLYQP
jgi:periplasmic glucans biosynthesis protein